MADPNQTPDNPFSRRPPPRTERTNYNVIRIRPGREEWFTILSHDSVGAYTHYWSGKTMPCLPTGCPACGAMHQNRWYSWLAVVKPGDTKIQILEISRDASDQVYDFYDSRRTLRGWGIRLKRRNQRANSGLIIDFSKERVDADALPAAPRIEAVMRRIWRIPDELKINSPDERIAIYHPETLTG